MNTQKMCIKLRQHQLRGAALAQAGVTGATYAMRRPTRVEIDKKKANKRGYAKHKNWLAF